MWCAQYRNTTNYNIGHLKDCRSVTLDFCVRDALAGNPT